VALPERPERLLSTLRVVVAFATFAIYAVDPSEDPARRPFANAVLAMFAAYGGITYVLTLRTGRRIRTSVAPWVDFAWVTLLVGVSQGTSGIFYPLYLFAILGASFWGGFRQGFPIAVASSAAFAVVGAATAPVGIDVRLFLFEPLYLLVLGYLTAVWGQHEVRSRARLALLHDVTTLANPRFGVDQTMARVLEAVRAFHDADSCRVVVADEHEGHYWTQAARRGRGPDPGAMPTPPEVARPLLSAAPGATFSARALRRGGVACVVHDGGGAGAGGDLASVLAALDAASLLSVPFRYHAGAAGRLYVARRAPRPFDGGDADFLEHVVAQVAPVLENLRLVDHLASEAATEERRRIARNLHDSVIQPYLGLRLGLSAARDALASDRREEASAHLERLVELADGEIQTLRGYTRQLRDDTAADGEALDAALRRFCRRFSEATGIRVEVASAGAVVADRIAAEVVQMTAEALSNVRRHTAAARVLVRMEVADGELRLTVVNDGAATPPAAFFPRSLGERAAALGGSLAVESVPEGKTEIRIRIPL
jgi:signal transduction histidine kinase